jgi:hypothetical protein
MNPSIDIDDETFGLLQKNAEPFVDTPASVLRRLLGLGTARNEAETASTTEPEAEIQAAEAEAEPSISQRPRRKGKRAPRGSLLPESEYEMPILTYLAEHGGRAPSKEVIEGVGESLSGRLTETDRETVKSGDIRWKNRVAFVRLRLIEKKDLEGDAPRGTWSISEQGRDRVAEYKSSTKGEHD